MSSVQQKFQFLNPQGQASTAILSTIDLIEHMAAHHEEQARECIQRACWHRRQLIALQKERHDLVADVEAVLAEAERWLA